MNDLNPDLLQVFPLNLMNSEETGTETRMELLGTQAAYFWVDFNLTYESNLDHHSVTYLSLRCSVTGPKFLVLQSKLHLLLLFKKNVKVTSRRGHNYSQAQEDLISWKSEEMCE